MDLVPQDSAGWVHICDNHFPEKVVRSKIKGKGCIKLDTVYLTFDISGFGHLVNILFIRDDYQLERNITVC